MTSKNEMFDIIAANILALRDSAQTEEEKQAWKEAFFAANRAKEIGEATAQKATVRAGRAPRTMPVVTPAATPAATGNWGNVLASMLIDRARGR